MRTEATLPGDDNACSVTASALEAMILYEDFGSGLRAKQVLDRVVRPLVPDVEMSLQLWRMDVFEDLVGSPGAEEAGNPEVVIVSTRGVRAMPGPVMRWFKNWMVSRQGQRSLIVVSTDSARGGGTNPVLAFARECALKGGVDLLVHSGRPESEGAGTDWSSRSGGVVPVGNRCWTGEVKSGEVGKSG